MYQEIISFWFEELKPEQWWAKDNDLDQKITQKFSEVHAQAVKCELYQWRVLPLGRLAEIIVLDQFSRNIFRDSPLAFANDSLALALAQEAIALEADKYLTPIQRSFLYLPFMHSESLKIHEIAVDLYKKNGIKANLEFEMKHKKIIERFNRYPHRNSILGRISTLEEIEFLKQPDSNF